MMTSSNKNIFRVIEPLWGESTGHRWIPLTKASDADLFYKRWTNNRDAGDLRRYRAHYDITVMFPGTGGWTKQYNLTNNKNWNDAVFC